MCVEGNSQLLFFLALSHAPGSTKTTKFEEGVEILKLQKSVVIPAMTLTEDLE